MGDLLKWAITTDSVSAPGLLLVNLIVLVVGLHKQWLVPGNLHKDTVKERDEYKKALELRNSQDRDSVSSLQRQVTDLTDALINRQERRSRRGQ